MKRASKIRSKLSRHMKREQDNCTDSENINNTHIISESETACEDGFDILVIDILHQMKNKDQRSSRRGLQYKKSLRSVLDEARRDLSKMSRINIDIVDQEQGEYVDYDNIVVKIHENSSDYVEMK